MEASEGIGWWLKHYRHECTCEECLHRNRVNESMKARRKRDGWYWITHAPEENMIEARYGKLVLEWIEMKGQQHE